MERDTGGRVRASGPVCACEASRVIEGDGCGEGEAMDVSEV